MVAEITRPPLASGDGPAGRLTPPEAASPLPSGRRVRAGHQRFDCGGSLSALSDNNGPTEAINGRLEHLRGSALGFRNLTNYIVRSLWKPVNSDPDYTFDCDEPANG